MESTPTKAIINVFNDDIFVMNASGSHSIFFATQTTCETVNETFQKKQNLLYGAAISYA